MEYRLSICKEAPPILFQYIEADYPLMHTNVVLYNSYKLNVMLSDGLAAVLNERNDIYSTFSGDLLLFSPQEIHHGQILRQGLHKYIEILIPIGFFPNYSAFLLLFDSAKVQRTNLLSPPPKERAAIFSLAEKIKTGITSPSAHKDAELLALLSELLKLFGSLYERRENLANQNVPAVLESAMDFIRKEYAQDIEISDLAAAANCSTSYLSRIFKKHLGSSPYRYLTEYRLFVAEKMLRNGSRVTEAAAASGFRDTSSFIKCFKAAFGITPLQYRKKVIL